MWKWWSKKDIHKWNEQPLPNKSWKKMRWHVEFVNIHMDWSFTMLVGTLNDNYTVWWAICHIISIGTSFKSMSPKQLMWCTHTAGQDTIVTRIQLPGIDVTCQVIYGDLEKYGPEPLLPNIDNENASNSNVLTVVGFFIFVSTCILERVFFHLEGMCSDYK